MSWQVSALWRGVAAATAWGVAAIWSVKTTGLINNLPTLPDLSSMDWSAAKATASLTVIVPARDEAETIAATLDALLMADYPHVQIVAVDDRSTDATGTIMEEYAARELAREASSTAPPSRPQLKVIHITECAPGWLGKTFALEVATQASESDYVLFTDADILFSPSVLRRAMAYADESQADHLVVVPTVQVKSRGEGIVLGFCQLVGMWSTRPWRVADPKAKWDAVGIGAFNLFRREALKEIGGLAPQRLVVLEDIALGRRIKAAGLRQRIAFAPGLVLVHWAKGARGLVRVMTKNLFSGANFRPSLLLAAVVGVVVFCLAPIAGLTWWATAVPSVVVLLCIAAAYRTMGVVSGIDARYGWLYPVGAVILVYAMLRSMVVAWIKRGVVWRGTHYPLAVLRLHNSPLQWERKAKAARRIKRR